MIEVTGLRKHFGDTEVLRGIDLQVKKGDVHCVIGPSGSGKSTLLRCVNLLEIPTEGTVRIGQERLEFGKGRVKEQAIRALRSKTGMVFQRFHLFPHLTVLQNVMEGPITVKREPRAHVLERAERLLDKVGLAEKKNAFPESLSGGQQQRVAIARALALEPDVLLFDEPTSALDPELVGEVLKTMRSLAEEEQTMVIVTHEMEFARDVADEVLFIDEGRVVEQGPPSRLFTQPSAKRTQQFLAKMLEASR